MDAIQPRRSRTRKPSEVHHGYGRVRYIAAFVVSIVLFSLGGVFALYEGWHKFTDPHPIESSQWVPVAVLLVAIAMEAVAMRTALQEANHVRGDLSLPAYIKASRAPEIPVILLAKPARWSASCSPSSASA